MLTNDSYDKQKTCCFTGHRRILWKDENILKSVLRTTIGQLADEGITTFVSGGALGFDLMAAEEVLREKEKHPQVQLIMAIPCRDQHARWCQRDKKKYEEVLKLADDIYCLNDKYCTGCMHQRNRFMVEQSSVCVAYFNGRIGGTAHTLDIAREKGLRLINLVEKL